MAAKQKDFMAQVEAWFGKLPSLPKNWQQGIVTITPWIALIFGILGVLAGLAAVLGSSVLSVFNFAAGGHPLGLIITSILGLIASVLLLLAYPGTKARKMKGWNMLFYSEVVNLVAAVVAISLSGVIFSLIAFYLLYQIKSYYK